MVGTTIIVITEHSLYIIFPTSIDFVPSKETT